MKKLNRGGSRIRLCFGLAVVLSFVVLAPTLAQLNDQDAKIRATQLYNESVGLIRDGNIQRAESKLTEALRLDPNNANTLNNYGLVMLKLGRLPEARGALEKAIAINPNYDAVALNLGLACEGQGDLVAARKYLARYIEISKDRAQADKMKDHVAIIDKTLARGTTSTASANAEDYFALILPEQMHPWPKERMPIKIYVAPGTDVEGYKPGYGDDVQRAIDSWAKALDGMVTFKRVDTEAGADIAVKWTHDPANALLKAEGGDCKYTANGAGMSHANIQILTIDPSRTDKLNDFKVSWVSLHEFGHALGVSAHSNSPDDVMYFASPMKNALASLSQRDVRTFTRLYTEKLPDTWMTLNEDAIKLIRANKNEEALEKLTAAIKLAPDQKVLKQNLLLVEARISDSLVEAGKFQEAESHFIQALELEKQYRDQNFQVLLGNYAESLRRSGRASEVDAMLKKYGN